MRRSAANNQAQAEARNYQALTDRRFPLESRSGPWEFANRMHDATHGASRRFRPVVHNRRYWKMSRDAAGAIVSRRRERPDPPFAR